MHRPGNMEDRDPPPEGTTIGGDGEPIPPGDPTPGPGDDR